MKFDDLLQLPHIWDILRTESRPILIYGTGNGADKILDVMAARGIPAAGVFASDGFVRSREFRGMYVMSYSKAIETFGENIVILAAFGSPRDEVLSFIDTLAARHTLYIPDVPLFAKDLEAELFTPEYAITHREQIERAAEAFADEAFEHEPFGGEASDDVAHTSESAELFWEILAYRITGKPEYLRRTEPFDTSVRTCLPQDIRRIIDGGAFTGDTARTFIGAFPYLTRIVCAEPDARTFRKLSAFAESDARVTAVNASLGAVTGTDIFSASASRASAVETQSRRSRRAEVRRLTVDLLAGHGGAGATNADGYDDPAGDTDAHGSGGSDINAGGTHAGPAASPASCCSDFFGATDWEDRLLVKLDVEGAERAALEGARQTITSERPALAIALYHRTADIFEIPLFLRSIHADYMLRLRRARCIPGWEMTLFAK